MLMLVVIATAALGAVMLSMVIGQLRSSTFVQSRTSGLEAAQSGVDAAVGTIRAAVASPGGSAPGKAEYLPCTPGSPYDGPVKAPISGVTNESYAYLIQYFVADPSTGATAMACTSQGPFDADKQKRVPKYAVITSVGCSNGLASPTVSPGTAPPMTVAMWCAAATNAASPGRVISTTFIVQSRNLNYAGGLLRTPCRSGSATSCTSNISGSATGSGTLPDSGMCIDATSSKPSPGTLVRLQACVSGSSQQEWSFNPDNTMSLSDTSNPITGSYGLCLDAPYNSSGNHVAGQNVTLQNCQSPPTPEQTWTYEGASGGYNYVATLSGGDEEALSSSTGCLRDGDNMGGFTNSVGGYLELGACGNWAIQPDVAVGSGGATAAQGFLVNFGQFGRCFDIYSDILPSPNFMYAFPCRARPQTTSQPPAQTFTFTSVPKGSASVSTTITSTKGGKTYCATSPNVDGMTQSTAGPYVVMSLCDGSAAQRWRMYGSTAQTGSYLQAYRIVDSTGQLCLQPGTMDKDTDSGVNRMIVSSCNSDTLQKWNADPNTDPSQLTRYREN